MPQQTQEEFINKSIAVHGAHFVYDKVIYSGAKNPVVIGCKMHGDFLQTPDKHVNRRQGCPKCKKSARKDIDYFLKKSKEIHGDTYDYSEVIFSRMFDRVEIICRKHGSFWQLPANHINHKMGCGKCATESTRILLDDFIKRAVASHHNLYDYSKSVYINCATKIEIVCSKHGSFWQKPFSHINGADCPWCVGKNSMKEKLWLDHLNIPREYRNKTLYDKGKHYRVDAYDPIANTIYEFYGDYWHGNPKIYNPNYTNKHNKIKFRTLFHKTITRESELLNLGYKIISIWEQDFDQMIKTN
jgi:hypothetical protein